MKQNYTQAENVLTDCVSSCLDKLLNLKAIKIRDVETSVKYQDQVTGVMEQYHSKWNTAI